MCHYSQQTHHYPHIHSLWCGSQPCLGPHHVSQRKQLKCKSGHVYSAKNPPHCFPSTQYKGHAMKVASKA